MVGTRFLAASKGSGIVASAPLACHCLAPAGLLVSSHSIVEEIVEEVVAPLGGRLAPGDFRAAGDGVGADARAVLAAPAQTLVLDHRAFRLGPDEGRIAGAVGLAEGVAAGDQGDGLLIVHGHAGEGLADIAGRGERIGIAVGAFGIDVDQAHLHGAQRAVQLTLAAVALIAQPRAFRPPIELLRLPGVGPAAGEAEGLEAHGFQGDVADQDEEIGPGDGGAVFLLDRPEQAAGLVEVGVVGPAVERGEALLATAGAAATVAGAIGARRYARPDE